MTSQVGLPSRSQVGVASETPTYGTDGTNGEPTHPARDGFLLSNARDVRRNSDGLGGWGDYDWSSLPEKPVVLSRDCAAGWLYVVEFTFGVIKVGRTVDPRNRIQRHIKDATRFGGTVSKFWLSSAHPEWKVNEGQLIVWSYSRGRQTFGEYFADLGFDAAVTYAAALPGTVR